MRHTENLAKNGGNFHRIHQSHSTQNVQMCFFCVVNSSWLHPKEINFLEGAQGNANAHGAFSGAGAGGALSVTSQNAGGFALEADSLGLICKHDTRRVFRVLRPVPVRAGGYARPGGPHAHRLSSSAMGTVPSIQTNSPLCKHRTNTVRATTRVSSQLLVLFLSVMSSEDCELLSPPLRFLPDPPCGWPQASCRLCPRSVI